MRQAPARLARGLLAALALSPGCEGACGGPGASGAPAGAVEPAAELPAAERVFAARLRGGNLLLGALGEELWAAEILPEGRSRLRFRVKGEGAVQRVAAGDLGDGERLYVARGAGPSARGAPLTLLALDPESGAASELFRRRGERNEATHLSVSDVDADGRPELAFAYFESKYLVRTRHIEKDGAAREGEPVRMATSHAFADLDGDGRTDAVVGRLYGDAPELPGDLRVHLASGPVEIPTEGGVRALAVPPGPGAPELYFADGWFSDYGRRAKARLKRARFEEGRFEVEELGTSPDEYTFFSLELVPGAPTPAVLARGSRRLTLFRAPPSADAPWLRTLLAEVGERGDAALVRDASGAPWVATAGSPAALLPLPRL